MFISFKVQFYAEVVYVLFAELEHFTDRKCTKLFGFLLKDFKVIFICYLACQCIFYFDNKDIITKFSIDLPLFSLKCKDIFRRDRNDHHPISNSTQLGTPYFRMYLVILPAILYISSSFSNVIAFHTK